LKAAEPDATQCVHHARPTLAPTGSCSPGERHNLWEVPLWSVADENGQPIASMDPPGNAYDNYKREASWHTLGLSSGLDMRLGW